MPRIDPHQLLKCLSVLLSPLGAIKSKDEVQRLASLMNKFSKKLVSKCIYVQILKRTEVELLSSFMGVGGWSLVHMWLTDGIQANNWALVQELLELLLLCPVDVERLKINDCPKLVKNLTKDVSQPVIQLLASKLVEQWLKLVKGGSAPPLVFDQLTNLVALDHNADNNIIIKGNIDSSSEQDDDDKRLVFQSQDLCDGLSVGEIASFDRTKYKVTDDERSDNKNQIPILKISVKDGKQIVSKVSDKSERKSVDGEKKHSDKSNSVDKENNKTKKRESEKPRSGSSSRSGSSKSSKSKHSSSDRRHSSESRTSGDGHKISSKSSRDKERHSSSSSKDGAKSKDRKHNDKDKGSSDRSKDLSNKSKEDKPKDISNKSLALSIMKLGKIPKKTPSSDEKSGDSKKEKPSISIEVRKPADQNRPKTVKMFNSKFRSHGLEEEARPPPPRGAVKKPTVPPTLPGLPVPQKRSSPVRSVDAPPEKKPKLVESPERPGSIKLIPPKPKPTYLLESGLFMDALTASATNKKEPKKRKRRTSGSKDEKSHGDSSPPTSPTLGPSSPTSEESKPAPLRFYQDTLEADDDDKGGKAIKQEKKTDDDGSAAPASPAKDDDDNLVTSNAELEEDVKNVSLTGLKGVLCVHKRKGPKKSLRWRDTNLEEVQYFELDETERVNVTKTFLDMKTMEHTNEREAFKKVRNLPTEDFMEEKMAWRKQMIPIDTTVVIDSGKNSKEKHIQMNRQAQILQAIYFHKTMIPDSPAEPDHENHPIVEPTQIPLEDVTGNPDSVNDFQNTPWPEPKINPQSPSIMSNQQMFAPAAPFGPGFNQGPFPMPGFPHGPAMIPGPVEWPANGPNMMMNPDAMGMNSDMYMGPGPGYQTSMGDYPMMDNGSNYPPSFNGPMGNQGMNRSMGPSGGSYGFQKGRGGGMRGGPGQRGGHMPWRAKGPGGWNGPHRGSGRGRLCNHFQKKGYCRQGDSCPFVHSNPGHY